MYCRKWKPSKTQAREFAKEMELINDFCAENGISTSRNNDSYYFTINGQDYRVSNHSVEASNRGAYSETEFGFVKTRELYHADGRKADTIYIHAGKTRIKEIYNDLLNGHKLDRRGNRI